MLSNMLKSTAALLAIFASSAVASIALGEFNGAPAAWIYGESPCATEGAFVATSCGQEFKLDNGYSYTWMGCSGTPYLLNSDGSFNSQCSSASKAVKGCNGKYQQTYKC